MTRPRPLLLGHRGSPRESRENTLESFEAAMRAGLDGVELDVQRTADGVLVVHHDFHLPDGRRIAALRWREVAAAELPGGGRVPSLEAVLDWAEGAGAYLNLEIKTEGTASDGREGETARLVRRHGLRDGVIVSSFSPLALARVRFFDVRLETALLWAPGLEPAWPLAGGRAAGPLGVRAIHPRHNLITPGLVERAHRRGWRVNAWTVNDEATAARLLAFGVDGLIGDLPGVLLGAAGRSRAGEDGRSPGPAA